MLQLVDPAVAMFPASEATLTHPGNNLSQCLSLQDAVEQVAELYEFQWHPYFIWMQAMGVERQEFIASQIAFQHTVNAFTAGFQTVLERLPDYSDNADQVFDYATAPTSAQKQGTPRRIKNVRHQLQRDFQRPGNFQACLQSLAATRSSQSNRAISFDWQAPCPITLAAANHQLTKYCLTQPTASSAALLGMVEYLYVEISAIISRITQQRDWASAHDAFCYQIHDVLTVSPNRDLFTIAHTPWQDVNQRPQIAQALLIGAKYLWEVYDELDPNSPSH